MHTLKTQSGLVSVDFLVELGICDSFPQCFQIVADGLTNPAHFGHYLELFPAMSKASAASIGNVNNGGIPHSTPVRLQLCAQAPTRMPI